MRQNAARVQLAAQFNERRQEGNAYTYIFRGSKRGFQEAFRRIPRRRFDSERRIPRAIPTTIHHVCAERRGGNWRGSRGRLSRAPAENQQVKVKVKVKVKVEVEVEVEVKVEVRWGESCLA